MLADDVIDIATLILAVMFLVSYKNIWLLRSHSYKERLSKKLNGNVLRMPHDRVRDFLLKNGYMLIGIDGRWKARHNKSLINLDELGNIRIYNATV